MESFEGDLDPVSLKIMNVYKPKDDLPKLRQENQMLRNKLRQFRDSDNKKTQDLKVGTRSNAILTGSYPFFQDHFQECRNTLLHFKRPFYIPIDHFTFRCTILHFDIPFSKDSLRQMVHRNVKRTIQM